MFRACNPHWRLPHLCLTLLSAAIVLSSTACREDDEEETTDQISHATGAADVLLRVDELPSLSADTTTMPVFVVYGDGQAVTPGAPSAASPTPLLLASQATTLSEAGIQAILRAARTAGLFAGDQTYTGLDGPDPAVTRFVVHADGHDSVVLVTGLGTATSGVELSDTEREARNQLVLFRQRLGDLATWLPTGAILSHGMYKPTRVQLTIQAVDHIQPNPTSPQAQPWPLAVTPDEFGVPTVLQAARCGVVEGSALEPVLTALRQANQGARWDYQGTPYTINPRILLPDDAPCSGPLS